MLASTLRKAPSSSAICWARSVNLYRARAFSSTPRPHLKASLPVRARYVRFGEEPGSDQGLYNTAKRWDPRVRWAVGLGSVAVVYYVSHLEQVPETGRWRFMDVNPNMETKLAGMIHEQILRENKGKILPANHPVTRKVREVAEQLLHANNLGHLSDDKERRPYSAVPPWLADDTSADWTYDASVSSERQGLAPGAGGREWKLVVVHDPRVVNAAATYGNIIVYTGIFQVCSTTDELAAVLAHEMGHVVARHMSERYSFSKYLWGFAFLINAVTGVGFGFSEMAVNVVLGLPMGRKHELEADKIGVKLAAKACFDPEGAVSMFQKLSKHSPDSVEFLQTHPAGARRIKQVQDQLPEAYRIQAATPECAQVRDMVYSMAKFGGRAMW
ncbi:hypothetical protein GLOTRDRAFT_122359 [Gloeophyllum trabeum ATCC 11539]|uniref:Peptidase M48 domain-containing protein n=1 Tax=Gloeophyllum trabeum (strain ATCC 11539 / FP-39264 / Madison 617) TaxID=670483 RepID=S7Q040_GLOTA|nr:uncharacterized protein GLOTRDRAFT_122359 [Gloeophyllum trabeum ATCC 11539]EPQ53053.1 hypothetical protein GLOTRDRAFT_122359 [Gloeophyllum trabeum ATCC 11539]